MLKFQSCMSCESTEIVINTLYVELLEKQKLSIFFSI